MAFLQTKQYALHRDEGQRLQLSGGLVYVLEGALTCFWGSEKKEAVASSYFYQPRGTPHGFRVEGNTPAKILYLTVPAGLDRFIAEQGQLAPECESVTAAARYKIEIMGPLPE